MDASESGVFKKNKLLLQLNNNNRISHSNSEIKYYKKEKSGDRLIWMKFKSKDQLIWIFYVFEQKLIKI